MYVCLCNGVTDGLIRQHRDSGAESIKDLRNSGIKICDQCCKCNAHIKEILSER